MARRDEILQFADDYLDIGSWTDYGPNGMQVHGADEVTHIATAVSASAEAFTAAAGAGADMLVVHHGLFWRDTPQVIGARARRRLELLFDNDITLAAYHLPLDAHPEIGNNALICRLLGLERGNTAFAVAAGKPIGLVGEYREPVPFDRFRERLESTTGQAALHLGSEPSVVQKVAICSGGGQRYIEEAIAAGADVLVTGEAAEPTQAIATEGGIAFFAAGHYATEVFGVRRLGELLAERFGVGHSFHHVQNPV